VSGSESSARRPRPWSRPRPLPSGALDAAGLVLRPPVTAITGWALAERGLGRVEVAVGDAAAVRARIVAIPRPDVAALAPEPSAPICGWEALVEVPELDPGSELELRATAVGPHGRTELGAATLRVGEPFSRADVEPARTATLRERADAEATESPSAGPGLNLLAITHQLDLGGGQLFLQNLLRALMRDPGTRITVLSPSDGPLRRELERLGIEVHIVAPLGSDGLIYESRMRELVLLASTISPDVVLVNTTLVFWGVDLAVRIGAPVLWTIHESVALDLQPFGPLPRHDDHIRGRFLAALRDADRIAFAADSTRDLYRGNGDESRLVRIDYGIPIAEIDDLRRELDREQLRSRLGYRPGERLVICVGTVEARKAQAALVLAFARLASEFPEARLALVGDRSSGYSRGIHEALARMPGVADRIRMVDLTPDTAPWFEIADAFALPSDIESLPLAILEAMTFDLPVLAAGAFGVGELIEDNVNGLLCEPRCLDSLTGGLRRLLALDPGELAELGRSGGRTVRSLHDLDDAIHAYRDHLSELAGTPLRAAEAPV
jgi:glycosyltransferase involved in cell wall biosynthesis